MGDVERTNKMMKFLCLAAVLLLITIIQSSDAACDTRVCEKFYQGVYDSVESAEWNDELKVEKRITKWCKEYKIRPFDKMCYYMEGVLRKVSKDLIGGAPAALACKRYAKHDDAICTLKEPRKLDKDMNLEKMRVKQLRELMQEFGVDCPNCLEKSDMIKRIKETIMSDKKEL